MQMKKLAALVVSVLVVACTTVQTTQPGVVGVDRKQTVSPLVDSKALTQEAGLQYQQTLQAAQKKSALNVDKAQTARVRRIADRLIPTVAAFRPDAVNWKWEINVLSSKDVNAWCMPGGKIAVYTGLIETIKPTDDELAAVMGHEIAHALREHAWERASKTANAQLGIAVLGIALGQPDLTNSVGGMAYQAMFGLPNSREQETEADRIGVELAARAGYDPRAAISLWDKMGRLSGGSQPPQWLSTHPSNQSRQQDLAVYSQKVMPLYEQAKAKGG